jgi:tetratricopeptide (TPR) repeat protein
MARPELLARRPEWPVAVRLEPLAGDAVDELLSGLPEEARGRVAAAAGGNPLFLTEMLAMAREDGAVDVPPTLRALLGARLDQLDPQERTVLERGAVEGEIFHRGSVQALATPDVAVTPKLAALVRRQLIRPDRAQLTGDDGFRFRHLLIRDAAYEALPKVTRAELHERFADWLGEHGADLVELDEIIGYHLEQAARFRGELGAPDAELNLRAAKRLANAARRVQRPGNDRIARGLFARAVELTRPFALDVQLEIDYAETLHWEDPAGAMRTAAAAAERARAEADSYAESLALVAEGHYRVFSEHDQELDRLEALAQAVLPLAEAAQDHAALVVVWRALGYGVANGRSQMDAWARAAEQCVAHARVAGWPKGDAFGIAAGLVWGSRPADEALRTLDELAPELADPSYDLKRAYLLSALCRFEEAWALAGPAIERLNEAADARALEWPTYLAALEGDYERAAEYGRRMVDLMIRRGLVAFRVSFGITLGRYLCRLGRFDEALSHAQYAGDVDPDDGLVLTLQARIDAARGEHDAAALMARRGVETMERTDQLIWQGDAWWDLGEVLLAGGDRSSALAAYGQALERYERKRNFALAEQLRRRLDDLR